MGLGRAVLATPVYAQPPRLQESGLFRVKGSFPDRPAGIGFEMLFQQVEGEWRLFGIGIVPLAAAEAPDAESEPRQPVPKSPASGG